MEKSFKDTYTNEKDKEKPENAEKIAISNEAYAIAEAITEKLELLRLK